MTQVAVAEDPLVTAILAHFRGQWLDGHGPQDPSFINPMRQQQGGADSSLKRGLQGSFFSTTHHAVREDAADDSDEGGEGLKTGCPWQLSVTASTYNIAFPDLNCVYQVLLYWGINDKKIVRISGGFPLVRYFSYQSYDIITGKPITSLIDYQITAATGINPFAQAPKKHSSTGTYEVHLTPRGDQGLENELAILPQAPEGEAYSCKGRGCLGFVIFRIYTAEPGSNAFLGHDESRMWGYVPPPQITIRYTMSFSGSRRRHARMSSSPRYRYYTLPPCQPEGKTLAELYLDRKLDKMHADFIKHPTDNQDDNFMAYTATTTKKPMFPNADATYLFATASNDFLGQGEEEQLVARIQGKLPLTAKSLHRRPRVGDLGSYEVRYVSISTLWLKGAGPTIDTVMDASILHKYRHVQDWDRTYTIVTGPTKAFLRRCPMIYHQASDLFLSTSLEGKPATNQGFLYRQILSQWQVSGKHDKSVALAKHQCERHSSAACKDPQFIKASMEDMYPHISYYMCRVDEEGGCTCRDSRDREVDAPQWRRSTTRQRRQSYDKSSRLAEETTTPPARDLATDEGAASDPHQPHDSYGDKSEVDGDDEGSNSLEFDDHKRNAGLGLLASTEPQSSRLGPPNLTSLRQPESTWDAGGEDIPQDGKEPLLASSSNPDFHRMVATAGTDKGSTGGASSNDDHGTRKLSANVTWPPSDVTDEPKAPKARTVTLPLHRRRPRSRYQRPSPLDKSMTHNDIMNKPFPIQQANYSASNQEQSAINTDRTQ